MRLERLVLNLLAIIRFCLDRLITMAGSDRVMILTFQWTITMARNSWNWKGLYNPHFEHDACGVGFVARINGEQTHDIIDKGIRVLENLTHRGATGSDKKTGDGAGLLFQVPDAFFRRTLDAKRVVLPAAGQYAVGQLFLPTDSGYRKRCENLVREKAHDMGMDVIAWRDVPVQRECLGEMSAKTCPVIRQVFLQQSPESEHRDFEQALYLLRRRIENAIVDGRLDPDHQFYICSLSSRTICYKGYLMAGQVPEFYTDLVAPDLVSALIIVHQRYSTNTFPSWGLAQPFRMLAHNGEINTLRGNISNMKSRTASLKSAVYGSDLKDVFPVIMEDQSDSACLDNMLEFLVMNGRTLPHSMLMTVPQAWGTKYHMGRDCRAFYEYHSMIMEPWDGPAALIATDGIRVCGMLDRNGLRPNRYTVSDDGLVVAGSETGVLDIPEDRIREKGRLAPGRILMVDTQANRLLHDEEVKAVVTRKAHYRRWVEANRIELRGLFDGTVPVSPDKENIHERKIAFGYSREDIEMILAPMASFGKEPIGSMGDDMSLAVLSEKPQLLFNYFKQLFAQVTNPAIDPLREELVMSLTTYLGPHRNILEETPEHARLLKLRTPVLSNEDLRRIRSLGEEEFGTATLDMTFEVSGNGDGLAAAVKRLCDEAEQHVRDGKSVLILSDRSICEDRVPVPSLLATSAVNEHLTGMGIRTRANIVIESGEPREVEHFALLLGYGASAVNPYLAMEIVSQMSEEKILAEPVTREQAVENYIRAVEKGLLKILSKMGISTLRSYRGAKIFEALGLDEEFAGQYFRLTPSRISGAGIENIAADSQKRHAAAFRKKRGALTILPSGGRYKNRQDGERHLWNADTVRCLQQAARNGDRDAYKNYAAAVYARDGKYSTLRSLLDFKAGEPVPVEEVEPVERILKRFVTSAMSFGSISREAHEAMALAMHRTGSRSNSGEGGEDRNRYQPLENGECIRSETKQVASGRFGVTAEYLVNCSEIQIKIAQGAKPGEGGHLPGHKVNAEIAGVRYSTPGVSLISPPPHHDIYSIEDLSQLIFDLRNLNPTARINVKLVSEVGVGTIAAGVAKGKADAVLISGGDGGTGASPLTSIKYAGMPWELGLSETHQVLQLNGLRSRICLQTDGQMRTGRDVAAAALLGAEEFGFGSASLVCLGCVMMRKCQNNTCPVGVATQDPELRKRFRGHADHIVTYLTFVAEELREIMAELGFRSVGEMVGRSEMLEKKQTENTIIQQVDFSKILYKPECESLELGKKTDEQEYGIEDILDRELIQAAMPALKEQNPVSKKYKIQNTDRTVCGMLSGEIARRFGHDGLADDTIQLEFTGSAGQSFCAFGARGITARLIGDANDYLGKGLSGARVIVKPPEHASYDPGSNTVVGNVALYGAIEGEVFINGMAGERFAIRNSGATAVVEGIGDHGCEYMTGGTVVIIGPTGVNFAAGMSGGVAYVFDPHQDFDLMCNTDMVDLDPLSSEDDVSLLRIMLEKHIQYTGSRKASGLLEDWEKTCTLFVKVMSMEYRRAIGQMERMDADSRRTRAEVVTVG